VGLLKQLLVQQLGLTEKSTQEDWQSFSRYGPASEEVQADSGIRDLENVKACHAREGQMSFKTGTGDIATCDSPRTSTESCAAQDSVILASQDSQASNVLVMDHMILTPEMPPAEPEGGLDESGEHFFDAREAHSDDNPSEGDGAVKKEEKDVNLRISGKWLSHFNFDCDYYKLSYMLEWMLFQYLRCVCVCAHAYFFIQQIVCSLPSLPEIGKGAGRLDSEK
jgi:Rho guanine nucleotide exchange factor 12